MSYSVEYPKSVEKQLAALPIVARQALISAFEKFAMNPLRLDVDVAKIKGSQNLFRIRCGGYRLLFRLSKVDRVLEAVKAADRKDAY